MRSLCCLVLACIAVATLGVRGAAAQAHVNSASLYFWEQARGPLAPTGERHEAVLFDAVHSRLIGFNLALHHDAPGAAVTFPVSCQYIKPDSTTIGPIRIDFQITPNQRRSDEARAHGWDGTGHWMPGTYWVQCSAGGNLLEESRFEMTAPPPTVTGIRFYEKETLGPGEPGAYATRFDAAQSRFMATEVTFALPAVDPEIARRLSGLAYDVRCWYIRPDGKPMGDFRVAPQLEDSIGTGVLGYQELGHWALGTYHALCSASGRILGSATFEMASAAAIANAWTTLPSPFPPSAQRVTQIRLFPMGSELTPLADRQYTTRFYAGQTARIAVELEFEHAPFGRAIVIPIDCTYHLSDGEATDPFRFTYEPQADWNGGYSANGFGWDQPGQWPRGDYTAVCSIYGPPVAVERFTVLP